MSELTMFASLEDALLPLNSARQFAELSGLGESTLSEWRTQHTGPAYVKIGRRVFYPKEAILAYLNENLKEHQS